MATLRQDLTYALRVLLKRPGFTIVCALTLALGIAANTTIFSLINGVLLRPLPYPHAERLLDLWTSYAESNGQPDIFSPANYLDVAAQSKTLEAAAAYTTASFTLAGDGLPEFIPGLRVSAAIARVLAIEPQLGRWFTNEEDIAGHRVVVLSDALWHSRFGGDRGVLGRALELNGRSYTIVGVLPAGAGFPSTQTQLYAPMSFSADERSSRGNVFLNVVARMRAGNSLATAQAELRTIAAGLSASYPKEVPGMQMGADSLQESLTGGVRPLLLVLWAAVGFMLAVGCANVANLLLTHAAGRQREFALRRSLGATAGRLARQLLTESVTLAVLGGGLGLAISVWAVPAISAQLPTAFPRVADTGIDRGVLWFTLAISLLSGLLFGLAPVIGSARRDLAAALRDGERSGSGTRHRRLGRVLAAGEMAVVLALLVGAGLMVQTLARLSHVNPGFRADHAIAWQIFLPSTRYPNVDAQRAFYRNVLEQVKSLPGVRSAAFAQPLPFGPLALVADSGFEIAGRPSPSPDQRPQGLVARADASYFATMEIPVLRGRVFTAQDTDTSNSVVISNALARRYFPDQDPVGQRLLLGRQKLEMQIVGVVGDVKHNNLRSDLRPEFYLPLSRFTPGAGGLIVRVESDPRAMLSALQRRVWSVDSNLAGNLATPVETALYTSLGPARIAATLLGGFAAATLLLGLVGVYGVMSYSVRQRTRELGIRLALGATQNGIARLVLGEAAAVAGVGMLAGIAGALLLTRYMQGLLFGITALDLPTYLVAALSVPVTALLAAYLPARRAMRVDPAASLRE